MFARHFRPHTGHMNCECDVDLMPSLPLSPLLRHLHFKSFEKYSHSKLSSRSRDREAKIKMEMPKCGGANFKLHLQSNVSVYAELRGQQWALLRDFVSNTYSSCCYHIQSAFTIFIRNDKSVREKWNIHKTIKFIANQISIYRNALDTFPDLRLNCINVLPMAEQNERERESASSRRHHG